MSRVNAAFLHEQCANRPCWPLVWKYTISLYISAEPSFMHHLQMAKMASSRTSVQNNGSRAQNNGPWV